MTPGNWNDLTHQTAPRLPTESSRLLLCRSCYSAPVLGKKKHKPEIMFLDCKQSHSLLLLTLAKNVVQAHTKKASDFGVFGGPQSVAHIRATKRRAEP